MSFSVKEKVEFISAPKFEKTKTILVIKKNRSSLRFKGRKLRTQKRIKKTTLIILFDKKVETRRVARNCRGHLIFFIKINLPFVAKPLRGRHLSQEPLWLLSQYIVISQRDSSCFFMQLFYIFLMNLLAATRFFMRLFQR